MKSNAPAVFTVVEIAEDGTVTLRTDHPVIMSTVSGSDLHLSVGRRAVRGRIVPLNADWTPDGDVCATRFRFWPDNPEMLAGVENAEVYYRGVMTTSGVLSENIDPTPPVMKGDLNGDLRITAIDRLILARYLAGWSGYEEKIVDMDAADIDRDGEVSATDRVILSRYLAQWEGYGHWFE